MEEFAAPWTNESRYPSDGKDTYPDSNNPTDIVARYGEYIRRLVVGFFGVVAWIIIDIVRDAALNGCSDLFVLLDFTWIVDQHNRGKIRIDNIDDVVCFPTSTGLYIASSQTASASRS